MIDINNKKSGETLYNEQNAKGKFIFHEARAEKKENRLKKIFSPFLSLQLFRNFTGRAGNSCVCCLWRRIYILQFLSIGVKNGE